MAWYFIGADKINRDWRCKLHFVLKNVTFFNDLRKILKYSLLA